MGYMYLAQGHKPFGGSGARTHRLVSGVLHCSTGAHMLSELWINKMLSPHRVSPGKFKTLKNVTLLSFESYFWSDMPTSGNTNLYFEAHKPVFFNKNLYFLKTYTNRLPLPHFITHIFITSIVIHFMPHCPFSPHYCGVSQLQCAVLCRIFHLQQCWNQRNTTYTLHGFLPFWTALWSPSCANTPPWKSVFFYFWTPSHL